MLPPLFLIETLQAEIDANELILTPNLRLTNKILQACHQHQEQQGISIYQTPRIFSIDAWFNHCWQQIQTANWSKSRKVIANTDLQGLLWEKILSSSNFLQNSTISKHSQQAYKLIDQWNLNLEEITSQNKHYQINEEFFQWCKTFESELAKRNWITQEQAYRLIGEAFEQGLLPKENRIHLLNFDDVLPVHKQQLVKASNELKIKKSNTQTPKNLKRFEFDNSDSELTALCQWAKAVLERQPLSRIGIIVPDLGQTRKQVEKHFIDEFETHSYACDQERYTLPFNFSAGIPLGETPLIISTLNILKLNTSQWPIELMENILLSPFWGNHSRELEIRCKLIDQLKVLGSFTISAKDLLFVSEKLKNNYDKKNENNPINQGHLDFQQVDFFENGELSVDTEDHSNFLHQLIKFLSNSENRVYKQNHSPSFWVERILEQLSLLQWPGERKPDSEEFQQTQLWYKVLERFANFDQGVGKISYGAAISYLLKLASTTPFQAEVEDSPIQILGILEGAGLSFTHCWVLGLDQQAWPPAPSPNPMLPQVLQREYKMPHSSHLRELDFANSLTKNYLHCADEIVFSSSITKEGQQESLVSSSLINHIPLANSELVYSRNSLESYLESLQTKKQFSFIHCGQAQPPESKKLPGGSGFIKAQSENPFNAFAKYRLSAKAPLLPMIGFSAIEKGNILHNSLNTIWKTLTHQKNLLEISEDKLTDLIKQSVQEQVYRIHKSKSHHLNYALCDIEIERQSDLIYLWMQEEKLRPPFTVIASEETRDISLANINFKIRIDRVDRLEDGSFLIIDYKTSASDIYSWVGERPKEPQLPFYALSYDNNVSGIAFIQININEQVIKGFSSIENLFPPPNGRRYFYQSWKEAIDEWSRNINGLLGEIKSGQCPITFRDNLCLAYSEELIPLNRFYEADIIAQFIENHSGIEH
jgi:probable DNA repair protein